LHWFKDRKMLIKIGSRKSKLALIQANLVSSKIQDLFPEAICEIVPIITSGDQILDKNLYEVGGKALFLKELEEQLLNNKIDIAVHSLKDAPGILPEGLVIAAVLEREDPRDALISKKYKTLQDLPKNSKIGTSSPRRMSIIRKIRPDLQVVQFRGNIDTRLTKILNESDGISGAILAVSGLKRAGLFDPAYCHPISEEEMLPAAAQGIIGLEIRENDQKIQDICSRINHLPSWILAIAERSFLEYLDASCKTPMAAFAKYENDQIVARYMLSDFEGTFMRFHTEKGLVEDASNMGIRAAKKLSIIQT